MPKQDDLQKHTLNLIRGDYARIQACYPDVGAGPIIRRVIHRFAEQLEATSGGDIPKVEVNL